MKFHLPVFLMASALMSVCSHPVWDLVSEETNMTEMIENDAALMEPDDPRGILDYIDSIINGRLTVSCASGQGQKGRCSIGTCATLGNFNATSCPGRLSFLKCCPFEKAAEVFPEKVENCGKRPVASSNLIVGGSEAVPHSWPWSIALYRVNNGGEFFQCGGSIINRYYVLTAAHCIKRPFQKLTAKDFRVKVGAHYLSKSGEMVDLEEIIWHESYSPTYHNDDIALLRLKSPLNFQDSHLAAVCLPERGSTVGRTVGQMATMVGWGVHDQDDFASSPNLQEVQVPISNQKQCQAVYTDLMGQNGYLNWNNTVCASYAEGGKDTCQGDSGGSMTIPNKEGIFSQVGVVSFGYGCAQKGYPGVYTYVNNYLGWIGAHMKNI